MLAICIGGSLHAFFIIEWLFVQVFIRIQNFMLFQYYIRLLKIGAGFAFADLEKENYNAFNACVFYLFSISSLSFLFSISFPYVLFLFSQFFQEIPFTYKLLIFINLLYQIQLMNFETNQPFDQQLSRLLAIIIMCEKKIEELKKKLAGNEQFHTRLIFQRMDYRKKGQITPQDIVYSMSSNYPNISLSACQSLCRKCTVSGAISYQELLALIIPKTDKALAQRMLIRTTKRGAILSNYLWKFFTQMILSMVSMTEITEEIRKSIQNCAELNHLQMVQFFKKCLRTPQSLWRFCNENSDQEYDFTPQDTVYLSSNIRSGNPLSQMNDEDIKQLICPLDMNFQRTTHQMASYYENIKLQKYKTINGTFFQQTKADQMAKKANSTNFLNSNYRSFYPIIKNMKENNPLENNKGTNYRSFQFPERQTPKYIEPPQQMNYPLINQSKSFDGSQMYLDNFIKPLPYEGQRSRGNIELDNYLAGRFRNEGKGYQKFRDDLPEIDSSSGSNSAFVQY